MIATAVFISQIIAQFATDTSSRERYIYAGVFSAAVILSAVLGHIFHFGMARFGMGVRVSATGLAYRKVG